MDKETLIRLATPASIFALALSITTLPFIARASGIMQVEGSYDNRISPYGGKPIHVRILSLGGTIGDLPLKVEIVK